MLPGARGGKSGGRGDTRSAGRRGGIVWGQHASGLSQPRRANRSALREVVARSGGRLRACRVPREAREHFATQYFAAGISGAIHTGEVRAGLEVEVNIYAA